MAYTETSVYRFTLASVFKYSGRGSENARQLLLIEKWKVPSWHESWQTEQISSC